MILEGVSEINGLFKIKEAPENASPPVQDTEQLTGYNPAEGPH